MKELARAIVTAMFRFLKATTGYIPPARIFRHLHFVGPFVVTLPNKKKLKLYSWGNRVENELAWRGWDGHEPEERRCWAAMIENSGDILDIGANTATFAITAKALSPHSRVFAFEPVRRIADRARENVAISNCDIEVVCAALARRTGELPIFDPGGENAYSASLDADFLPGEKASYLVPVDSLDDFCARKNVDPTAIKLDVEGFEGQVICGGVDLIRRGRCTILCEWLGESSSHIEAQELLSANGYMALDIRKLTELNLSILRGFANRNVILIHRRKARHLVHRIRSRFG